ncbi:hypothetical protein GGP88_002660, partial [Salinibacter ruber]|nr:hypothetical protein [Salinibacter ruber]
MKGTALWRPLGTRRQPETEVIPNAEDHYTDWTVTDGRIAVAKKFHLSCTT